QVLRQPAVAGAAVVPVLRTPHLLDPVVEVDAAQVVEVGLRQLNLRTGEAVAEAVRAGAARDGAVEGGAVHGAVEVREPLGPLPSAGANSTSSDRSSVIAWKRCSSPAGTKSTDPAATGRSSPPERNRPRPRST